MPPSSPLNTGQCQRCGTCCRKGGPSLHIDDLDLIGNGKLQLEDLVTIRAGEFAISPLTNSAEPVRRELVKINGTPGSWSCKFLLEPEIGCAIYANRPQQCRILKCWDTAEIEAYISAADTICRADLLAANQDLLDLVGRHEEQIPCAPVIVLAQSLPCPEQGKILAEIAELISRDLAIRDQVINSGQISPEQELFVLGRPLFIVLRPLGIEITMAVGKVCAHYRA